MPYLTLTEKPKATTESWFSCLLWHLVMCLQYKRILMLLLITMMTIIMFTQQTWP